MSQSRCSGAGQLCLEAAVNGGGESETKWKANMIRTETSVACDALSAGATKTSLCCNYSSKAACSRQNAAIVQYTGRTAGHVCLPGPDNKAARQYCNVASSFSRSLFFMACHVRGMTLTSPGEDSQHAYLFDAYSRYRDKLVVNRCL